MNEIRIIVFTNTILIFLFTSNYINIVAMKYRLFFTILLNLQALALMSQDMNSFYVETNVQSKFSIGNPTRDIIEYEPGVRVNVPKVNKFRNPVYGLNISLNYMLNDTYSLGIGSGLDVSKYDYHPVEVNEYIDKVMIPLYLRLNYRHPIQNEWNIVSNIKLGYQFSETNYYNTNDGFLIKEKGGALAGINIGIGKTKGRYSPELKLGYEFNCFRHDYSIIGIPGFENLNLTYDDKIEFKSFYHLLTVSLGLKL